MNLYLDSSALAKGYIVEDSSAEVVAQVSGSEVAATSWMAIPEVLSALSRLQRSGLLSLREANMARSRFKNDEQRYFWLATDRKLLEAAGELTWRHGLRAADAIHLATAQKWSGLLSPADILFATFDKQLARAGQAEGLAVWPSIE